MNKFWDRVKRNPMWYFFLVILIVMTPFALGITPESTKKAICTALAIDAIEDDQYEVSTLIFVPTPNTSFVENYKVVSAKGNSVSTAVNTIGLHIGKQIALSHVEIIMINEELGKSDINNSLDYLVRKGGLANNTTLLCTEKSAKDLLIAAHTMDTDSGLKLDELIRYNQDFLYSAQTSLETFYQGYFSPVKASIIAFVKLEDSPEEGITIKKQELEESSKGATDSGGQESGESAGGASSEDSSGGGSGQSQGGGSGQSAQGSSGQSSSSSNKSGESNGGEEKSKNKVIANSGDTAIFKNGKFVVNLSGKIVKGINWINPLAKSGVVNIIDNGKKYYYGVRDKILKSKASFRNGLPVVTTDIRLKVSLQEMDDASEPDKLQADNNHLTNSIRKKIEEKIKLEFLEGLNVLREYQSDIIGIYEMFYKQQKEEFIKFLARLEDPEDFLRYIAFEITTDAISS